MGIVTYLPPFWQGIPKGPPETKEFRRVK
jgi:hypothetical protein